MKLDKEKQLIEASQLDKAHFAPLYKEYVADVYRYAYSIVNSKDVAEEITSETFTRALEKIDNFEWRGTTIKTWFFSIARIVAYNNLKDLGTSEISNSVGEIEEIEDIEDKSNNSSEAIDIKLQKDMQDLLQQLPSLTREIIVLRIWEEYKYNEIAEIVDRSEDSVKKQFYRGVARLRELLKEKGHDESNIALPIIFVGIEQVGRLEIFRPEDKLVSLLENNLNLIKNCMENNTMKNSTASSNVETVGNVVSESTTKPKNLSLFGVEIPVKTVLLGTVALLVIGVGIGGMYLAGQLGQGGVEDENEQEQEETLTSEKNNESSLIPDRENWKKVEAITIDAGVPSKEYVFTLEIPEEYTLEQHKIDEESMSTYGDHYGSFTISGRMVELSFGTFYRLGPVSSTIKSYEFVTTNTKFGDIYRVKSLKEGVNTQYYVNDLITEGECIGGIPESSTWIPCSSLFMYDYSINRSLLVNVDATDYLIADEIIRTLKFELRDLAVDNMTSPGGDKYAICRTYTKGFEEYNFTLEDIGEICTKISEPAIMYYEDLSGENLVRIEVGYSDLDNFKYFAKVITTGMTGSEGIYGYSREEIKVWWDPSCGEGFPKPVFSERFRLKYPHIVEHCGQ